jgi:hypothetical protein
MRLPGEAVAHRSCLDCGRRRPYTLLEAGERPDLTAPSSRSALELLDDVRLRPAAARRLWGQYGAGQPLV